MGARFPVVFFDLDGTLLRGTSVSSLTATWLGRHGELDQLERRYRQGLVSNAVVAETSAAWFAGRRVEEVGQLLAQAPWIEGIGEVVDRLHSGGAFVALATVTWLFAAELVADRFGFDACCGTEMPLDGEALAGVVGSNFDAEQKADFVESVCARRSLSPGRAAAVGDSRNDVPMFSRVGYSIALNADGEAKSAADVEVESGDLRELLPFLLEPNGQCSEPRVVDRWR